MALLLRARSLIVDAALRNGAYHRISALYLRAEGGFGGGVYLLPDLPTSPIPAAVGHGYVWGAEARALDFFYQRPMGFS